VQLNVDTCSGTCARRVTSETLLCARLAVRSATELFEQQLCYRNGGSVWRVADPSGAIKSFCNVTL
jgi:hypothetical protein